MQPDSRVLGKPCIKSLYLNSLSDKITTDCNGHAVSKFRKVLFIYEIDIGIIKTSFFRTCKKCRSFDTKVILEKATFFSRNYQKLI